MNYLLNIKNVLMFNTIWMTINILLAVVAVVFGWLALKTDNKYLKILYLLIWILFIPNTLYISTDILHIPKQWVQSGFFQKIVITIQYTILEAAGFLTFVASLYPFEKILKLSRIGKKESLINTIIFVLNFAIGFGIVLGRIQRANSWEVFTNTEKVVTDTLHIITSLDLVLLVLFFGFFGNFVYLLLKKTTLVIIEETGIPKSLFKI